MRLPKNRFNLAHIADVLEKIRFRRVGPQQKSASGGIVPLRIAALIAVSLGLALLLSFFLDSFLAARIVRIQGDIAVLAGKRSPSVFISGANVASKSAKMSFSAFDVVDKNPAAAEEPKAEAKPIDAFSLIGTLPPVAAWVKVEEKTSLVLKDQEFNGYVLEIIEAGKILFTRDGENFPLYLVFASTKAAAPSTTKAKAAPSPSGGQSSNSGIQNADFNGNDGAITKELLNSLLMNPYEEIAKVRLVPTDSGMTIRSMRPDSLLMQLGMKQGDVLTGINGIPIKDVSNLSNAINSMLTGERLDFNVLRDKEQGKLGYVVK